MYILIYSELFLSKKTTARLSSELTKRINKLKRKPDTSETVITEAVTLLEEKRKQQ